MKITPVTHTGVSFGANNVLPIGSFIHTGLAHGIALVVKPQGLDEEWMRTRKVFATNSFRCLSLHASKRSWTSRTRVGIF